MPLDNFHILRWPVLCMLALTLTLSSWAATITKNAVTDFGLDYVGNPIIDCVHTKENYRYKVTLKGHFPGYEPGQQVRLLNTVSETTKYYLNNTYQVLEAGDDGDNTFFTIRDTTAPAYINRATGGNVINISLNTTRLQQAVNALTANPEGGTLIIPSDSLGCSIDQPLFICPGSAGAKTTITGDIVGTGFTVRSNSQVNNMGFVLGIPEKDPDYPLVIDPDKPTAGHYPQISKQGILDGSEYTEDPANGLPLRYGLRTVAFDASSKKNICRSGYGNSRIAYMVRGVSNTFVINLCVKNNGTSVMRGVIAGLGAGDYSSTGSVAEGNINDPHTVWTFETDPLTGEHAAFKCKYIKNGQEYRLSLPLTDKTTDTLKQGIHRFSVQIDFASGTACALVEYQ